MKTKSVRLLLVALLATSAVIPAAGATAEPAEQGGTSFEMAPVEHPVPKSTGRIATTNDATQSVAGVDMVRVEIVHDLDEAAAIELVESVGGVVEGIAAGMLVQALYPSDQVDALGQAPGVRSIRQPTLLAPAPRAEVPADFDLDGLALQAVIQGEEVTKTNAHRWHAAGLTGRGIRVGIIDSFSFELWQAGMANGELPNYAGAFSSVNGATDTRFPDRGVEGGFHGVGVAEIVHEMAPGAELYLVDAQSAVDLQNAIDYLDAQGVDIITRSQGARYDGPGDGTGVLAELQREAIRRGMVWLNSAGNHAGAQGEGGYWRSEWIDANGNGWMDFGGGTELMAADCGFFQGLRWNDWGSNRTDYDIYVFDDLFQPQVFDPNDPATFKASSIADQTAGAEPLEAPDWVCGSDTDYIAIFRYGGGPSSGDVLEMAINLGRVEFSSNPFSAGQPFSDSNVGGALSVGAVDPARGATIGGYSSRGPSNDGRVKPDVSAASCVRSFSFELLGIECFSGTSAATPAVAGAVALVLEAGLTSSPHDLHQWLLDNALADRGAPGSDNDFGHGELVLPGPPIDFLDDDDSVFETDIEWLARQGITAGCNPPANDRFCPDDSVTRGQMAAFLQRALPALSTSGSYDFADDNGSVFEANIGWLAAAGITAGCNPPSNTLFCPEDPVTRGQMAAFLVRALGLPAVSGDPFTDDDGSVFEANIESLAAEGITSGCNPPSNTLFCPGDPVTRGQMAAFLRRALTG